MMESRIQRIQREHRERIEERERRRSAQLARGTWVIVRDDKGLAKELRWYPPHKEGNDGPRTA